jgi:4-hydroxy-3-methylbut-2-en-1-yl diphosphate synthase IspG/GcpE
MGRMTKPNQFITVVTCPECGRTGTATWKENNNSDDADYEMVLKDVSVAFASVLSL